MIWERTRQEMSHNGRNPVRKKSGEEGTLKTLQNAACMGRLGRVVGAGVGII